MTSVAASGDTFVTTPGGGMRGKWAVRSNNNCHSRRRARSGAGHMHMHSTLSDGPAPWRGRGLRGLCPRGYDFVAMIRSLPAAIRPSGDRYPRLSHRPLHHPFRRGNCIRAVGQRRALAHRRGRLPWDFAAPQRARTRRRSAPAPRRRAPFLPRHPGWFALTARGPATLPLVHAVEVYNHGTEIAQGMPGDGWYLADMARNEGRRLTAIATDDMHRFWCRLRRRLTIGQGDRPDPRGDPGGASCRAVLRHAGPDDP